MAIKKKSDKSNKKFKAQQLKKKICRWLEEAMVELRLRDWELRVEFVNNLGEEGKDILASIDTFPEYMKATMNINLELCQDREEAEVRFTCYHEVGHMFLSELVKLAESRWVAKEQLHAAEEKLCQILSRIIGAKK